MCDKWNCSCFICRILTFPSDEFHFHTIFGPQGNCRIQFDALTWDQTHCPFLCNSGNDKYPFHPCEWLSNATSYPSSKWKVTESGQISLEFCCPPVRIEL